jgi:hypothetical protein
VFISHKCISCCITKGDDAVTASNYGVAVELYSTGIGLDSSCEALFMHQSKANLKQDLFAEALHDAKKVQMMFICQILILILLMHRSLN